VAYCPVFGPLGSNRGISFISEEYLPRKLKEKDWLA